MPSDFEAEESVDSESAEKVIKKSGSIKK